METVLIIGANSDIAYDLILALSENFQPKLFILASKNFDLLQQKTKNLLLTINSKIQTVFLDVANDKSYADFYHVLPEKIDCVVYCAGCLVNEDQIGQNPSFAIQTLNINYTGAMVLLDYFASKMENYSKGIIIGISSVAGLRGRQQNYHYGAAKAAFTTYLSGLRNKLSRTQIQVITVLPGFVSTKMIRHMRPPALLTAKAADVAQAIIKAIKKKQDVVYVKPIWRWIMLIIMHIPEKIFKYLAL